ncbi:MAG: hypothetical protein QOD39_813 [Mycobacterium sp.]|jgi:ketosteroid isomerase-like protein|nr:hypothetical protein [Mycobacterium sp.]
MLIETERPGGLIPEPGRRHPSAPSLPVVARRSQARPVTIPTSEPLNPLRSASELEGECEVPMKSGTTLSAIHPAVEAGVNNQDIDGLMALYDEDASMVLADGSIITGLSAIREQWSGLLAMGGHMTIRSRYAIAAGDLAVLSNEWTFEADGDRMSAVTAEVARRQPDGGWLYVIDHPFAGSEPNELAALAAALDAPHP